MSKPEKEVTVPDDSGTRTEAEMSEEEVLDAIKSGELELDDEPDVDPILELAWDGSASRFSDEQYRRSCLIVNGNTKSEMHLPVREPNGQVNCGGVSAAASRIGQVQVSAQQKAQAARKLITLMNKCGQEPSDALKSLAGGSKSASSNGASGNKKPQNLSVAEQPDRQLSSAERFMAYVRRFFMEEDHEGAKEATTEANGDAPGEEEPTEQEGVQEPQVAASDGQETPVNLGYVLPVIEQDAVELAPKDGRKRFRRPILPVGAEINYEKGGVKKLLKFTTDRLDKMITNFKNKAFPQVPLLAEHPKSEAVNPDHYFGEMVDAERDDKWLYGIFEVTERGAKLLEDNPKLPVSVGYFEDYTRKADKQNFGPSLQHVATVYKPYVPDLGDGWASVQMSEESEADEVMDLRGVQFSIPDERKEDGPEMSETSAEKNREEVSEEVENQVTLEEHQAVSERAARLERVIRQQGVARLLAEQSTYEVDGRRFATPPAKLNAFKVVLAALEGSENDPITLADDGSANFAEGDVPAAVAELLKPWQGTELGQRTSDDDEVIPEEEHDLDTRIHQRTLKVAQEKELSYEDANEIVLSEIEVRGEVS